MIIDILRNYPVDGKLYSTAYGDLKFKGVYDSAIHTYSDLYNKEVVFDKSGRLYLDGGIISDDCMLFPSRGNHAWSNWRDVMFSEGNFLFDETDTKDVYIFSTISVLLQESKLKISVQPLLLINNLMKLKLKKKRNINLKYLKRFL